MTSQMVSLDNLVGLVHRIAWFRSIIRFFHRCFWRKYRTTHARSISQSVQRVRPWYPRVIYLGHYTVFGSCPGHPGKQTKAPQVGEATISIKSTTTSDCSAVIACIQWSNIVCCVEMLCKRILPSQYKNNLFGLPGHNAGSFTAFIVNSAGHAPKCANKRCSSTMSPKQKLMTNITHK